VHLQEEQASPPRVSAHSDEKNNKPIVADDDQAQKKPRTVWPIAASPDASAQRKKMKQACGAYPDDTLALHFLHSAVDNMLPLHSSLYGDNVPGMLFSGKDHVFAAAATDPQSRFGGRFPTSADQSQQHGTRPHAVLWRLNLHLKSLTTTSLDAQSDEACALLPYFTCSPVSSQFAIGSANAKADCLCVVSSALLADFRTDAQAVEHASSDPAMAELQCAREQMRWLPRDPFDGSAEPRGSEKPSALPRIIDSFNGSFSFGTAPLKSDSSWQQHMANQLRASVLVTRVDDDNSAVTDRNWLSGVVVTHRFAQPSDGSNTLDVDMHPPQQDGVELPIDIVLLQHGKPRAETIGHLEPLLPATELFRKCAGVSHPAFTGRPSAWLPFSTVREEKRFGTPYYDGVINFEWNAVRWMRAQGSSSITSAAWGGEHVVIRAGSVIKYRSNEDSVLRQGVVLLTYVHLSAQATEVWKKAATEQAVRATDTATCEAIDDFCTAFPLTPVATLCVWQLKTDHLSEGSTEWATQAKRTGGLDSTITVDRVHSVALPDPHNKLWEPVGPSRTVQHRNGVTAQVKSAKRPAQQTSMTITMRAVDSIVHEQSDRDARESALVTWFRSCQQSDNSTQLHSFYADLVATAHGDFNSRCLATETVGHLQMLMKVRRLLNIPQRQTEPVRSRNPQAHALSAIFDSAPRESGPPNPSAAAVSAAAGTGASSRSRRPAAAAPAAEEGLTQSGSEKILRKRKSTGKVGDDGTAAPSAAAAAASAPPPAKKGKPAVAPQETAGFGADAVGHLFSELSNLDADEHEMPFAALVWQSLPTNYSKERRKAQLAKMESTARKEALVVLAQHDRPMRNALDFAINCCTDRQCNHDRTNIANRVQNAILCIKHSNTYPNGQLPGSPHARLHGLATRAWTDQRGQQPPVGSPSVRERHRRAAALRPTPLPPFIAAMPGTVPGGYFPPSLPSARGSGSGRGATVPIEPPSNDARSEFEQNTRNFSGHHSRQDAPVPAPADPFQQMRDLLKEHLAPLSREVAEMKRQGWGRSAEVESKDDSAPQAATEPSSAAPHSGGRGRKRNGGTTPNSGASAGKPAAAAAAPASAPLPLPSPSLSPSPSPREQRLNNRADKSGDDTTPTAVTEPPSKKPRTSRGKTAASKAVKSRRVTPADDATIDIVTPGTVRALFGEVEEPLQQQRHGQSFSSGTNMAQLLATTIQQSMKSVAQDLGHTLNQTLSAGLDRLRQRELPNHQPQRQLMPPQQEHNSFDRSAEMLYLDTSSHHFADRGHQQVGFYGGPQQYHRQLQLPPPPPPSWQQPRSMYHHPHSAAYSQQQRGFPSADYYSAPQQYPPHNSQDSSWIVPAPDTSDNQSRHPSQRS